MRTLLLVLWVASSLQATIVDRVALTVGRQVITELQIDEEIRVTALLDNQPINRSLEGRRAAADRLISQLLVRHEMELSHYPLPGPEEVDAYANQVRSTFENTGNFSAQLEAYQLTENVLRDHLALQMTMLRFVDLRFHPDVNVSEAEIQSAYEQKVATWRSERPGTPAPSISSWRDSIRQALLQARTDEVLNAWLEESRKQVSIVYLDKSLQ